MAMSYAKLLVQYPYLVLGVVFMCSVTCLVVIVTVGEWPDFEDPRLGFEARGTKIGKRLVSYDQLIKHTRNDQIPPEQNFMSQVQHSDPVVHNKSGQRYMVRDENRDDVNPKHEHGFHNTSTEEGFFCDIPRLEYARVVYEHRQSDQSLFTHTSIQAMCRLEDQQLRSVQSFQDICIHRLSAPRCCRSWSLGNYIALFSNKSSCSKITAEDVESALEIFKRCAPFYNNGTLKPLCNTEEGETSPACKIIPADCKRHDVVYYVLHYLSDIEFLQKNSTGLTRGLKYSVAFLPIAAGIGTESFYKDIDSKDLKYKDVHITGIKFGMKENLFNHYLKKDAVWFGVAFISIFLFMWMYTCSLFLTSMALLSIIISLDISYFLYTVIYKVEFFPFKNLLAIVILLGIGADDVFVYSQVWSLAKREKNAGTLEKIVSDTLKHATLSMFVTSFTTAAAFFSSYISSITALCCFALFAGTVVMVNFILMVTWIPATVVIQEKWCSAYITCEPAPNQTGCKRLSRNSCSVCRKLYASVSEGFRKFFDKVLPCIICKARYLWLLLLSILGMGGVIIIFYYPKLRLPSSNEFQVFAQDHPFEVYDFQIKDHLWFEKSAGNSFAHMPLIAVWGIKAADTGNKLDPYDEGVIQYDEQFNIAHPESQSWLRSFCQQLRSIKLYQWEHGLHLTNCFIDSLIQFMKRGCRGFDGENLQPCCGNPAFPYTQEVFSQCIEQWLPLLKEDNPFYTINRRAGLRFSEDRHKPVAAIVQYLSNEPYSMNYNKMKSFYTAMDTWMQQQLQTAPAGMKSGWFISDLEFFDLQDTIAYGTPIAIGVSIAISSVVAFVTTLNIFVTVYAILSISFAIFVTIATLVLLGWELNILEAVTLSVAVGLSIDFTLHYGVAYSLTPKLTRTLRVTHAVSSMGSPVAMAALTTFLAGALIMPSTVLAYRQLGTFLMLVMGISWIYSTFFFLSILWVVGPQGDFGQLHMPSSDCCDNKTTDRVDKTTYTAEISHSTSSSSSANPANGSDTYEMEPLTDNEPDLYSSGCASSGTIQRYSDDDTGASSDQYSIRLVANHNSTRKPLHCIKRQSNSDLTESESPYPTESESQCPTETESQCPAESNSQCPTESDSQCPTESEARYSIESEPVDITSSSSESLLNLSTSQNSLLYIYQQRQQEMQKSEPDVWVKQT